MKNLQQSININSAQIKVKQVKRSSNSYFKQNQRINFERGKILLTKALHHHLEAINSSILLKPVLFQRKREHETHIDPSSSDSFHITTLTAYTTL